MLDALVLVLYSNLNWPWVWNVISELLVHLFFTTLHHYKVDSPRPVSFARNSVLHFLSHLFNKSLKPPLTPAMCIYRPSLVHSSSTMILLCLYMAWAILLSIFEQGVIRIAERKNSNFWCCSPHIHITLKLLVLTVTERRRTYGNWFASEIQKHENPNHTPQKYSTYEFGGLEEREHLQRHRSWEVMRLAGMSKQACFTCKTSQYVNMSARLTWLI